MMKTINTLEGPEDIVAMIENDAPLFRSIQKRMADDQTLIIPLPAFQEYRCLAAILVGENLVIGRYSPEEQHFEPLR